MILTSSPLAVGADVGEASSSSGATTLVLVITMAWVINLGWAKPFKLVNASKNVIIFFILLLLNVKNTN